MQMLRTMSGPVVTVLLGLASLGSVTPASAAEPVGWAAAGDLPQREVSSRVVETQRNELVLKGNVSPGHAEAPVYIQKRNCLGSSCTWYRFDVVRSNEQGGYRSRITAPRRGYDYWRAKVKAHGGYATSYSEAWRTYTS